MTKVEQLRKRLAKLQDQIIQQELDEVRGSTCKVVMDNGLTVEDYPLVLCPACGEEAWFTEARLDIDRNRWIYYDGFCQACHTDFRIGEVPDRCPLCQETLPCDPREDVNQLYNHWCKEDNQYYCTPCFMQLFFDGYFDLSSDNPKIDDSGYAGGSVTMCSLGLTHVGSSLAPYRSRLAAKGYREAMVVGEWDEVKKVCRQIANEGRRYLVLSVGGEHCKAGYNYVIYETDRANSRKINWAMLT